MGRNQCPAEYSLDRSRFPPGLCDEAHFTRSCLTKTSLVLLNDLTQAKAALFCLEQITDENTTEDLRVALQNSFLILLPMPASRPN